MTEHKNRGLRRPLQIALTAAAMAVVMCVTAAAANPEVVRNLWEAVTMSVTVLHDDGDMIIMQTEAPEISLEDVDGRTVLTIDGESADITDALAQDGKYVGQLANENGTGTITVQADKNWELEFTLSEGETVRYGSNSQCDMVYTDEFGYVERDGNVFIFTEGDIATDAG